LKSLTVYIIIPLMLLSLASCSAPKNNLFVLVPDPDGKTGQIAVTNQGGTQIVVKPGDVTEVKDAATKPAPPRPMDEKEIARIFGAALSAQPALPVIYILNFKSGTADLTEESTNRIPEVIATISERKSFDISIVGHSDTVGAKQKNYEISLNRALRIKVLFVSKGVDPRAISTESHGEDNPLVITADEVAESRNRRVEVTVR
jgi:outer membrane protein OmpA-like peptidoglycan-associated protein